MISRMITWYLMLTKRLIKKIGFMIILFMIPVFALVFRHYSKENTGGFLRIALATENGSEELAEEIMEKVNEESMVFQFLICETPKEARRKVDTAQADAAWIIEDNLSGKLADIGKGSEQTLVKVYEKKESSFLKLAREKIFVAIYPHIAYTIYENYVRNELLPGEELDQDILRQYYEVVDEQDGFVEFDSLNSDQKSADEVNYLTATLRGLLMIMMLLAGIASTMYFLKDDENGVYSWVAGSKKIFVSWGNNIAALMLAGIFVTLALVFSGNYTTFLRESTAMLLFVFMASAFCSILGVLFRSVKMLCIVLPTVLVVCIVFCPIFINLYFPSQQLLPPYLYLFAINEVEQLKWMLLYCVIAYPMGYVLNLRKV